MSESAVLEARQISKYFPGVVANEDVNLSLNPGEILALLGENGAGKSTLMNQVLLRGARVFFDRGDAPLRPLPPPWLRRRCAACAARSSRGRRAEG